MVSLINYEGREQSYVKHVFLESYLERLMHKTASTFHRIAYVDGFAGPWQSVNEKFEDTSFGIALSALRRAKASWKTRGRSVEVAAYLIERDADAYSRLAQVPSYFPEISVATFHGGFVAALPEILQRIPSDCFCFFFVDPKGWKIPLRGLMPILTRDHSELVFNFMFDFVNRAVNINDPSIATGLDGLMPLGNWRDVLNQPNSERRKSVLIKAFADSLAQLGNYNYVAEATVLKPIHDRPLYLLVYATRHKTGIEVFRDCQILAEREQSRARAENKVQKTAAKSGQAELFPSLHDMGPDELAELDREEMRKAEAAILEIVPLAPNYIKYDNLWPRVLANHVVRRISVNAITARLRKEGKLHCLDWEKSRRVPQPEYRLLRPKS